MAFVHYLFLKDITHIFAGQSQATQVVNVWGANPMKFGFTFEMTFLSVFPDTLLKINYIDYPKGKHIASSLEKHLRQNSRATHSLVEIADLKDYDYFVIELEANAPFDYFAYTTNREIYYDSFRSLPDTYWNKFYSMIVTNLQ
ncbi:uncharacterized protein LOC131949106 [Physella acuta]|uniref:uncharacterized protein LOC131949106 n=1 Tax=Physella acuta TaxID=109671 RepID=UPI0027DDE3B8|nr:uncharacterized protein LOC131949106 [Physella acuta]